jgi:hypothetical protein
MAATPAEDQRERFNAQIDAGEFMEAGSTFMVALYHRSLALLEVENYALKWQEPPDDGFGVVVGIVTALTKTVEELGDGAPFRLEVALNALSAIAHTQAILEGRDPDCEDEGTRTVKLVLAGARMGHADTVISLCESGHWEDFGDAKWKLFQIGRAQRGRQAEWETAFLPRAKSFCDGKAKVTLGQLCRLAKSWADDERAANRNPGLPASDDGIKAGLRRMEAAGSLVVPGRNG